MVLNNLGRRSAIQLLGRSAVQTVQGSQVILVVVVVVVVGSSKKTWPSQGTAQQRNKTKLQDREVSLGSGWEEEGKLI